MKFEILSANTWAYPDQKPAGDSGQKIEITAAQNSYATIQILVEHGEGIFHTEYVPDHENDGPSLEIYQLLPVYVEKNTGLKGFTIPQGEDADYISRIAPYYVYDAMKPVENSFFEPVENRISTGLYLRWPTCKQKPGEYEGTFYITQGMNRAEIRVKLTIMNVKIPDVETLRLTNWFSLENMASYHQVKPWTEQHWEMIEKYGVLMREGRQTDFIVPTGLATYSRCIDGSYLFDFSQTVRFVNLYLKLGFRYMNGGTPIFRKNWADANFVVSIDGADYPATSEEAYMFLLSYFKSWYNLLCSKNWDKIILQHVADEPHTDCAAEYQILSGIVRKCMPGIPLIEAVEIPELGGSVDVWVPKNNTYCEHREAFERKRKQGDTLWFYTCCCPGGRYLNRFLDCALLRTRYLHWANYLYHFTGYLHWGLNHYECTNDPFNGRAGCIESLNPTSLPCGDSHIVYPAGSQVLRSVRFEAMRSGCEDYELLTLLEKNSQAEVDLLVKRNIQSFTEYNENPCEFQKSYIRLLEKLS